MYRLPAALGAVALFLASACTSGGATDPPPTTGSPAAGATSTIEVTMTDDLRYEPAEFRVNAGETVRFVVHNAGQAVHEFYVGDEEAQQHHEEEMREGGMSHGEAHGVSVEPGATETLEYTFAEAGELLVGCHEPGHYDGGMVARVVIEAP